MTMPSESPTLTASHASWGPMLEVAVREVFELMLSCKLTVPENPTNGILDITAMVGLAGQLCRVMSMQCSHQSAGLMASKMLGVEPEKIGPELCDAFGEICNMVAGNFKNKIAGLSDGCLLSVPTVITGTITACILCQTQLRWKSDCCSRTSPSSSRCKSTANR
jgi:CheY-specific phosphatase CheX